MIRIHIAQGNERHVKNKPHVYSHVKISGFRALLRSLSKIFTRENVSWRKKGITIKRSVHGSASKFALFRHLSSQPLFYFSESHSNQAGRLALNIVHEMHV